MAVLVYVLWKLHLHLPLITIIKIKWSLLCGNFPVPDRKELPSSNSFSRTPSAGQFSEGTSSAHLHLQGRWALRLYICRWGGFCCQEDIKGAFWSRQVSLSSFPQYEHPSIRVWKCRTSLLSNSVREQNSLWMQSNTPPSPVRQERPGEHKTLWDAGCSNSLLIRPSWVYCLPRLGSVECLHTQRAKSDEPGLWSLI